MQMLIFRFREEIKLGREAKVTVNHTTRQAARAVFRLTLANSKFTMEEASKVEVDTGDDFYKASERRICYLAKIPIRESTQRGE